MLITPCHKISFAFLRFLSFSLTLYLSISLITFTQLLFQLMNFCLIQSFNSIASIIVLFIVSCFISLSFLLAFFVMFLSNSQWVCVPLVIHVFGGTGRKKMPWTKKATKNREAHKTKLEHIKNIKSSFCFYSVIRLEYVKRIILSVSLVALIWLVKRNGKEIERNSEWKPQV